MKENISKNKSLAFALRVIKLSRFLQEEKKEFVLSKQLLRSGTAIGALVREAEQAESKADFRVLLKAHFENLKRRFFFRRSKGLLPKGMPVAWERDVRDSLGECPWHGIIPCFPDY